MVLRVKTLAGDDKNFAHLELRNSNEPGKLLMPPKTFKKIGSLKLPTLTNRLAS